MTIVIGSVSLSPSVTINPAIMMDHYEFVLNKNEPGLTQGLLTLFEHGPLWPHFLPVAYLPSLQPEDILLLCHCLHLLIFTCYPLGKFCVSSGSFMVLIETKHPLMGVIWVCYFLTIYSVNFIWFSAFHNSEPNLSFLNPTQIQLTQV